ncbi:MAG: hypothetical protein P4L16_07840 [Chlamydiales bacterium]|nr:hypothetical protein [Chlamydiales bacterium]
MVVSKKKSKNQDSDKVNNAKKKPKQLGKAAGKKAVGGFTYSSGIQLAQIIQE